MYVCTKCGNYKSFTVSIPETVTNVLTKVYGKDDTKYEEESEFVKNDCAMQEIEETMVCNECGSMGVVDMPSEYLDIELLRCLSVSLKSRTLSLGLMEKIKKEVSDVNV